MGFDPRPALESVAARLRALRRRSGTRLVDLASTTGIAVSTLSRIESGHRLPSLAQTLVLAAAHRVTLDELVGAPLTGNPRIHLRPVVRDGKTLIPLTRRPGGLQAYKMVLPGNPDGAAGEQNSHVGYEWLYVLNGRLRLLLADEELVLSPGEAAEFDTQVPHWFGAADGAPVEVLALLGLQGERAHTRARSRGET
ncbi:transcriptional regulator, XRE family with cupin sensor [Lentzea xinjiangensis]|uniref:Transcriptional regulator, XRE family with cupin sensor n=1 Tax=Lentzea xinjiangensis TaxID=402600 RepID=A0A1H9W303_9PSEU|nr:XRE family transcriptional regulator [Lentzea xinjiangensis]SES28174.1 transcriptional regulator, XRE family with cupin sensor [Lentzea xinjiangensis]